MEIILSALDGDLTSEYLKIAKDYDFVTIVQGSILKLSCDAIVSPANSFGFMDGGLDLLYSQFFGWRVQERLQKIIRESYYGELLVGQAEIVETDNQQIPFVIAAPTMRVPMILHDTVNPYLAARAVFLLMKYGIFRAGTYKGEKISDFAISVAIPGLGTGVGRVEPRVCARQVRAAIEEVIVGKNEFPFSWSNAQQVHQRLYTDDIKDLQYE